MVKKKRQSEPSENGDESTESCDETTKSGCPHVVRAVELAKIKRALKVNGFLKSCTECKKGVKTEVAADSDFEEDLSLWMCLRCGTQLCGRMRNKHALNHFNTPHSDLHAITTNTTTWEIYCYTCNNEISATTSKKLHECIEYLKKQSNNNPKLPPIELPLDTTPKALELTMPIETFIRNDKGKDNAISLNLPRVRGLANLGNTCFFNSVIQCLVQTPYLLNVLQEMAKPGERFTLPGGKLKLKGKNSDDEAKEIDLPPITGKLAEWGPLTRTLSETLAELQAGGCSF